MGYIKTIGGYIAAFFAFIGAMVIMWANGKRVGKAEAEVEHLRELNNINEAIAVRQVNEAREVADYETDTIEESHEILSDINASDNDSIARELRDEWTR